MKLLLRIAPMALVFALLAGPGDPLNWLLGALFAAPLAGAICGLRPTTPASLTGTPLLPWYILGVFMRTVTGAVQTACFLVLRREWPRVGFISCPAIAESGHGRMLLALAETVSPGSVVVSTGDELRMSAIDADAPEEHCRELRAWYARFLHPMAR
ncbi:MAG TPA: Na+/H+ antiporter subunit E [Paracoccaceae bacterium]|nr:Na+/H+ antiporter subunit E [Paracoccaceae bacterium]